VPDAEQVGPGSEDGGEEARGRAFWSGVLSFGLVSIPVELLPAQRSASGALRMLDADGTPLARRYYCPRDERDLEQDELVYGYELKGKLVVVSAAELEALAPRKSREIDLRLFVAREDIDPLYFERSYFLAPGAAAGKAYRLLGAVMERSGRAGIASFVMRDREYLIAIFSEAGLLRAETLRFAAEVRSSKALGLPKPSRPDARVAKQVARAVAGLEAKSWSPSEIGADRAGLLELVQAKRRKRQDLVVAEQAAATEGAQVIDLMEVLRKSLAESGLTAQRVSKRASRPSRRPRATTGRKGPGTARSARRRKSRG
jgi:DNA end-binding protein Ku